MHAACTPHARPRVPSIRAQAHFTEASAQQCVAFARMLRHALRCLHFGLDEPDFNMVIRSAALETGTMSVYRPDLYFRWYCAIMPRLGVGAMGGFEFSTGGWPPSLGLGWSSLVRDMRLRSRRIALSTGRADRLACSSSFSR